SLISLRLLATILSRMVIIRAIRYHQHASFCRLAGGKRPTRIPVMSPPPSNGGRVSISEELYSSLAAWLLIALVSGVLVVSLWLFLPSEKRRLWPPQRYRAVPWGGFEVCLALFAFFYWPLLIGQALVMGRFFDRVYGPGTALSSVRLGLWVQLIAYPLIIGTILISFRLLKGTHLYQLGLGFLDAPRNIALGWFCWLILSPAVLLLYGYVVWYYWHVAG